MILGDRLRGIRESKGFSQGSIEERTGLLRCYVSRVENNHTIPSIDTLEKWLGLWKCRSIKFSMTAKTPRRW
jgi:transcriptional regulator with XRE-family HTH domain